MIDVEIKTTIWS